MISTSKIIIEDTEGNPIDKQAILWNKRSKKFNSILTYIDKNPKIIKKKTLLFLKEFEDNKIFFSNNKKFYKLYNNFSYWDLSFFVEKSFYKSRSLKNVIKIIALKEIIKRKKIKEIILYSSDINLYNSIKIFSKKNKIKFLHFNKKSKFHNKNLYSIIDYLRVIFHIIKFLIKSVKVKKKQTNFKKYDNLIFSYNENYKILKDRYISKYWNNILNIKKFEIINIPTGIENENRKKSKKEVKFIDDNLKILSFLKIIFFWLKLQFKNLIFFLKKNYLSDKDDMWVLFKDDWFNSFCSVESFKNLYYFFLIENQIKFNQNYKRCLFLYENQPWERAVCFFWNKYHSQKNLYGVCHVPLRYWDLRYFNLKDDSKKKIRPQNIILNGKHSYKIFLPEFDGQKKSIFEALRYKNLNFSKKKVNSKYKYTLVIGDYLSETNEKVLKILENLNLKNLNIVYLSHPSNSKKIKSNKINIINIVDKNLLSKFKIETVVVPHISTAVIECYFKYKNVIVLIHDDMPNLSPMYLNKFDNYAYDSQNLKNLLVKKNKYIDAKKIAFSDFFYTTKENNNWKKFLKNDPSK